MLLRCQISNNSTQKLQFLIDLGARAKAAKVQTKNVSAEAESKFSWAETGKC